MFEVSAASGEGTAAVGQAVMLELENMRADEEPVFDPESVIGSIDSSGDSRVDMEDAPG